MLLCQGLLGYSSYALASGPTVPVSPGGINSGTLGFGHQANWYPGAAQTTPCPLNPELPDYVSPSEGCLSMDSDHPSRYRASNVPLYKHGPSGLSLGREKAARRPPGTPLGAMGNMALRLKWAAHPCARHGSNLLAHCSKTAFDLIYAN